MLSLVVLVLAAGGYIVATIDDNLVTDNSVLYLFKSIAGISGFVFGACLLREFFGRKELYNTRVD